MINGPKVRCPQCGRTYFPTLKSRNPDMLIQDQYPNATPVEREQLITGICSQRCWDLYLGVSGGWTQEGPGYFTTDASDQKHRRFACPGCGSPEIPRRIERKPRIGELLSTEFECHSCQARLEVFND